MIQLILLKIIHAEAEHFLTLFLGFGRFSGWFSYKSFSYKKKRVSVVAGLPYR